MTERTSIPTYKQTHQALKQYKPEDLNWPEFMKLVAEDFQDGDVSDQLADLSNSSESPDLGPVLERLDDLDGDSNLTYDDVVSATRKALRDELPDQVFR